MQCDRPTRTTSSDLFYSDIRSREARSTAGRDARPSSYSDDQDRRSKARMIKFRSQDWCGYSDVYIPKDTVRHVNARYRESGDPSDVVFWLEGDYVIWVVATSPVPPPMALPVPPPWDRGYWYAGLPIPPPGDWLRHATLPIPPPFVLPVPPPYAWPYVTSPVPPPTTTPVPPPGTTPVLEFPRFRGHP